MGIRHFICIYVFMCILFNLWNVNFLRDDSHNMTPSKAFKHSAAKSTRRVPLPATLVRRCVFPASHPPSYSHAQLSPTCSRKQIDTGQCCDKFRPFLFTHFTDVREPQFVTLFLISVLSHSIPVLDQQLETPQLLSKFYMPDPKEFTENLTYNRQMADYNLDILLDDFVYNPESKVLLETNKVKRMVRKTFAGIQTIPVYFWSYLNNLTMGNWGDNLAPYIIEKMSGKAVRHYDYDMGLGENHTAVVAMIGSILCDRFFLPTGEKPAPENTLFLVWGPGDPRDEIGWMRTCNDCTKPTPDHKKQLILKFKRTIIGGVRGPLSRLRVLRDVGVVVPVLGDPALLLPLLMPRTKLEREMIGSKQPVCLVLHVYEVRAYPNVTHLFPPGLRQIKIVNDVEDFPRELISCARVVTTSLHAAIASHIYNIPTALIKMGNRLGGDFKHIDYHRSIGMYEFVRREVIDVRHVPQNIEYYINLVDNTEQPQLTNLQPTKLLESFPLETKL